MGLSSLLTRSTNDVGQIQGFLFISLTMVVTAPLMLLGALALSLAQGWRMAPVIVVSGGPAGSRRGGVHPAVDAVGGGTSGPPRPGQPSAS